MFTLCECFEGKHKAATQWADYKLGPSFKQTEVINIEFPPHSTCGFQPASILLRIKHRRGSFPRTLMPFCASVWACIVFAPTCASFVSPLSHVQVAIRLDLSRLPWGYAMTGDWTSSEVLTWSRAVSVWKKNKCFQETGTIFLCTKK